MLKSRLNLSVVTGEVRIAIKYEEAFAQKRKSFFEGPGCAEEAGAIKREFDLYPVTSPAPYKFLDHLPPVSNAKDDALNSPLLQEPELMGYKRLTLNLY
jgi:hypothetical protein